LKWLASNTGELGVDKDRIAIGGGSAAVVGSQFSIVGSDRAEIKIIFQLLIYPMIDDKM